MNDKELDKFMKEHSDLFDSLANKIRCAKCKDFISSPFYNLGNNYNSFEGCKKCFDEEMNKCHVPE